MDYFELFSLPVSYQIDVVKLTTTYQELQRQYHPDRYATADEATKLASLQHAATINSGYQVLKKPLTRAEYILSLHDIDVVNEQHTMKDMVFLTEQLSLREELDEISQQNDAQSALFDFTHRIDGMIKQQTSCLIELLNKQDWLNSAEVVRKLRFLDKLQQQIEQLEERLFTL